MKVVFLVAGCAVRVTCDIFFFDVPFLAFNLGIHFPRRTTTSSKWFWTAWIWELLRVARVQSILFLSADRAWLFACRFGVFIRFSVDEALSLSVVANVEARLWSTLPSPLSASCSFRNSLYGFMLSRILFDFHWVHMK